MNLSQPISELNYYGKIPALRIEYVNCLMEVLKPTYVNYDYRKKCKNYKSWQCRNDIKLLQNWKEKECRRFCTALSFSIFKNS